MQVFRIVLMPAPGLRNRQEVRNGKQGNGKQESEKRIEYGKRLNGQ